MNYLKLKKSYPESISHFFDWVSINYSSNNYADNAYFRSYFDKIFRVVRSNSGDFSFWIIDNPIYINELKSIFPKNYKEEDNYLIFFIDNEDAFDVLFNCLEILILKKLL